MNATHRRLAAVGVALAAAALFAVAAEESFFRRLEAALARDRIAAPLDVRNRLRDNLRGLGALYVQPLADPDLDVPLTPEGRCPDPELGVQPVPWGAMPSSYRAPADWLVPGRRVTSLWIDWCRLRWLHKKRRFRGREFEEVGWLTLFEDGEARFASAVGVRMHGRTSRLRSPYSYRLYFRGRYGATKLPGELVDPRLTDDLDVIILKRDVGMDAERRLWPFVESTVFEIGRRLGAVAPYARRTALSLNGNPPRTYYFAEQISPRLLRRRFGHGDFEVVPGKVSTYQEEAETLRELHRWVAAQPAPLTAAVVAESFDLDSLVGSLLTAVVAGTGDGFQDALARDLRGELAGGRWFTVLWDHDFALRDHPRSPRFKRHDEMLPWLLDPDSRNLRVLGQLCRRLLVEDPPFRLLVARRLVAALNHELTPEFFAGLVDETARDAEALALPDRGFVERLRELFAGRPKALARQAELYLGAAPIHPTAVRSDGPRFRIDGREPRRAFRGWSGASTPIVIEIEPADAADFAGWWSGDELLSVEPRFELGATAPVELTARRRG